MIGLNQFGLEMGEILMHAATKKALEQRGINIEDRWHKREYVVRHARVGYDGLPIKDVIEGLSAYADRLGAKLQMEPYSGEYDDWSELRIYYEELETDQEFAYRLIKEHNQRQAAERKLAAAEKEERNTLRKLKAKYEGDSDG